MKNYNREKGITLVALAVIAVVLMILAGIIITTSLEDNGVLNIANNKKEETERMTIEESIKVELQEDPPETYAELMEFLKDYGEIQNEEIPDEAILVTYKGNYEIYVKDIWNIDKQELGISIGEYVEYSYDGGKYIVDGIYSGTNQNQEITIPNENNSIWKVIDINKQSKQVKIIPTSVNNYTVTLNGVNGFNNGVKILNDLCNALFTNRQYNTTARNIKIEDLEKLCSNISELRGSNYGTTKEYSSIICPYIVKQENDKSTQSDFFNGFEMSNKFKLVQTFYEGNITFSSSKYSNLIPKGSYWISSRAINNSDDAEYYLSNLNVSNLVNISGTKMFDSKEQEGSNSFNILPIVTLNNITFNSGTGTEDEPYKMEK